MSNGKYTKRSQSTLISAVSGLFTKSENDNANDPTEQQEKFIQQRIDELRDVLANNKSLSSPRRLGLQANLKEMEIQLEELQSVNYPNRAKSALKYDASQASEIINKPLVVPMKPIDADFEFILNPSVSRMIYMMMNNLSRNGVDDQQVLGFSATEKDRILEDFRDFARILEVRFDGTGQGESPQIKLTNFNLKVIAQFGSGMAFIRLYPKDPKTLDNPEWNMKYPVFLEIYATPTPGDNNQYSVGLEWQVDGHAYDPDIHKEDILWKRDTKLAKFLHDVITPMDEVLHDV